MLKLMAGGELADMGPEGGFVDPSLMSARRKIKKYHWEPWTVALAVRMLSAIGYPASPKWDEEKPGWAVATTAYGEMTLAEALTIAGSWRKPRKGYAVG